MIYVLQTAQYNKEYDKIDVLKIGYTGNWEKRRQAYEEYCHYFKVIQIYEGGTVEDETRLKNYFKDKIIYKNEWIECSDSTIKFFEVNDTLEKLRESLKHIIIDTRQRRKAEIDDSIIRTLLDRSPDSDLIKKLDIIKEVEKDLELLNKSEHIRFIGLKYSISEELLNRNSLDLKEKRDKIFKDNKELSKDFKNFKSIRSSTGRFKYIVDLYNRSSIKETYIRLFFELLPVKYSLFFDYLGPDRIKAKSYQESKLKWEWININTPQKEDEQMISEIYTLFEIGKRYIKADIKDTFKQLYTKYNYQKTAKAIDIEDYFNVKSILTPDKKHGFEILGKK